MIKARETICLSCFFVRGIQWQTSLFFDAPDCHLISTARREKRALKHSTLAFGNCPHARVSHVIIVRRDRALARLWAAMAKIFFLIKKKWPLAFLFLPVKRPHKHMPDKTFSFLFFWRKGGGTSANATSVRPCGIPLSFYHSFR